jgi:hypothetical protein
LSHGAVPTVRRQLDDSILWDLAILGFMVIGLPVGNDLGEVAITTKVMGRLNVIFWTNHVLVLLVITANG